MSYRGGNGRPRGGRGGGDGRPAAAVRGGRGGGDRRGDGRPGAAVRGGRGGAGDERFVPAVRGDRGGFRGARRGQGPAPLTQQIGSVLLQSNHFQLVVQDKCPLLYKHLVEIEHGEGQERMRYEFREIVLHAFLAQNGYDPTLIPFDGDRILVHTEPIKLVGDITIGRGCVGVCITPQGAGLNLKALAKNTGAVDKELEQVLNIVLNFCTSKVTDRGTRTTFLHRRKDAMIDLAKYSGQRDIAPRFLWMGHCQGFCASDSHPFDEGKTRRELTVCVNAAASLAYDEMPLIEFLKLRTGHDFTEIAVPLRREQRRIFELETRGLQFSLRHLQQRTKKVASIADSTAANYKFEKDGKSTSVADYFLSEYNVKLKYRNSPLAVMQPKSRNTLMPLEVLIVKRQRITQATTDFLKSIIGDIMTMDPGKRYNYIENAVQEVFGHNTDLDKFLKVAGSLEVEGTVLDPPTLKYHRPGGDAPVPIKVRDGRWNLQNCAFTSTPMIQNWVLFNCSRASIVACKQLFQAISSMANSKLNINFPQPRHVRSCSDEQALEAEAKQLMEWKAQGRQVDIAFIIIQDRSTDWYKRIKEAFDPICPTQVLCARRTPIVNGQDRGVDNHVANILSKVNMKVGGANQLVFHQQCAVPALKQFIGDGNDTIIFAADISHPTAGSCPSVERRKQLPSLSALVCSIDAECSKYSHAMRAQTSGHDIILELGDMFQTLLEKRRITTGARKWPSKVIYLRDGVSDGALEVTLNNEIDTLQRLYQAQMKSVPQILAIAIRKRHQTRFFPTGQSDSRTNPHPGTLVFDNLSAPLPYDNFYLIPHAGIKGTSHPMRVVILRDDFHIHDPEVKKLSRKQQLERYAHMLYQLCNLYGRCQRTVSIPAPVYYAHLLADRARIHVNSLTRSTLGIGTVSDDASVISGGSGSSIKFIDQHTMEAFITSLNNKLREIESVAHNHFYC